MKNVMIGLIAFLFVLLGAFLYLIYSYMPADIIEQTGTKIFKLDKKDSEFLVYQNDNFLNAFKSRDEAIAFASEYSQTYVKQKGKEDWVWDNYPQFSVNYNNEDFIFGTLTEAFSFARGKENAFVYNRANKAVIWDTKDYLPIKHMIEGVPLIAQKPELPRGCEVTALAMLLNYYGIGVSKMDLAEKIKKDPTPYSKDKYGNVTFGDPNIGFVGDIYDKSKPGLGVYNGPIFDLLKEYIGTDALNLTGANFSDLYCFLAKDKPVLVITNSTFKPLTADKFTPWKTEGGDIMVTNYEHSVLIKGYDEKYVYFNNPLDEKGAQFADRVSFIKAWEQMGRQAVTYYD